MKKQSCTGLYIICLLVLMCFACSNPKEAKQKPLIVTTTGIIADCLKEIVGEQAEVVSIMGPGVDPHLYKAAQGDLEKLTNADIIVYNGLHLEGKMAQVLESLAHSKPCYALGDFAKKKSLKKVSPDSEIYDPHIWFNPDIWLNCLQGLSTELSKHKGLENTSMAFRTYQIQVQSAYGTMLRDLDSLLPVNRRILITSHDAFGYFGDAFHFRVKALQGISTAAEYGIRDVSNLIDYVTKNKVRAVFVETSISEKNLQAVVDGANARGYELRIGGTLYSDALGDIKSTANSYTGMLKTNINTIITALR